MTTSLEQRHDGYFYATRYNSIGECTDEYFYDTYIEAFIKWEMLCQPIRLELVMDVLEF